MILLAALLLLLPPGPGQVRLAGVVQDATSAPIAGATITVDRDNSTTRTAADGTFAIEIAAAGDSRLLVSAPGYVDRSVRVAPASAGPLRIVLDVRGISEVLTVRSLAPEHARLSTPASVTVLDAAAVAATPALMVDDLLRSVPGFSLFRRSSSRVANPTTQGVTLRGMAASGASRAAVILDEVPLTDPFGGWVQWSRVPVAALARVEVARGGASDTHGNDAIGGGIGVTTSRRGARLLADGGSDRTARVSAFAGHDFGPVAPRGGVERFTTDGYVLVEPASAGPIDTPANSRHTAAYGGATFPSRRVTTDLTGGYLSESRGNGTPFQVNGTTTRHVSGRIAGTAGPGFLAARADGASTDYRQTFSAVLPGRGAERPSSVQEVDSATGGLSIDWLQPWRRANVLVAFGGRDTRADLVDQSLGLASLPPPTETRAQQRTVSLTAQLSLPLTAQVMLAGGLRVEHWTSRRQGDPDETSVSVGPRASVAYRHSPALVFRGSLQGGYRHPTINELYRDFRVGSTLTTANAALRPEASVGFEGSALYTRGPVTARAAAFASHLSDSIVNVTVESGPSLILRQRRNAASIRARGMDLEAEVRLRRGLALTASSALVASVFTEGAGLEGLRVPQVPTFQASAGVLASGAVATLALEWRYTSTQYDDDRNQFPLNAAGVVNARAGWRPRRAIELFAAVENAFDREVDVGRTPVRTIGLPRTARVGLRIVHP